MMKLASNIFSATAYKKVCATVNNKISGTFVEKFVKYMKTVYNDYKEVAVSVHGEAKQKPLKAIGTVTGLSLFGYSISHNPSEYNFRAKFIECMNNVSLVSTEHVNPKAVEHLKLIQICYNRDLIRHTSFGLFSIIWVDKHSDQCNMYESNCSYLQVPYWRIPSQMIDVGFWNIWWMISRKMLDYDINY